MSSSRPGESTALTVPTAPRSPWQRFYSAMHGLRAKRWNRRVRTLPIPVVSIGNLHWGGSGKTPLVAAIAAHLRDNGWHPAILSRGHGRRDASRVRVVSTGEGPLLGPLLAGDEPVLLAGLLRDVGVVVGRDRWAAGTAALERLSPRPSVFVLDDGFSHLALRRDLDLLAIPAADPFGGGRLPPSGRLREPLVSSARADALLVTDPRDSGPSGPAIAQALRAFGFRGEGFSSATRIAPARFEDGRPVNAGGRALVVAGVARAGAVFDTADHLALQAGFVVVDRLAFGDHHPYPKRSLRRIERAGATAGADFVLTTEKDAVKLRGRLEMPLASIPLAAQPEPAFWTWLDGRMEHLRSRLPAGVAGPGASR